MADSLIIGASSRDRGTGHCHTGCFGCIHACPKRAIRFVEFDEPNPEVRYRNPHVTLADLMNANNQR